MQKESGQGTTLCWGEKNFYRFHKGQPIKCGIEIDADWNETVLERSQSQSTNTSGF